MDRRSRRSEEVEVDTRVEVKILSFYDPKAFKSHRLFIKNSIQFNSLWRFYYRRNRMKKKRHLCDDYVNFAH